MKVPPVFVKPETVPPTIVQFVAAKFVDHPYKPLIVMFVPVELALPRLLPLVTPMTAPSETEPLNSKAMTNRIKSKPSGIRTVFDLLPNLDDVISSIIFCVGLKESMSNISRNNPVRNSATN